MCDSPREAGDVQRCVHHTLLPATASGLLCQIHFPGNFYHEQFLFVVEKPLILRVHQNYLHTCTLTLPLIQSPTLGSPSVFPNQGPRSGGTPVTLNGTNLDIGTSHSITIGEMPCDIVDVRYDIILQSIYRRCLV